MMTPFFSARRIFLHLATPSATVRFAFPPQEWTAATPISMQCRCERAFRVKDELAGKKIRCPSCKQVLLVPTPEPAPVDEEAALNLLMEEDSRPPLPPKPRQEPEQRITSAPAAWEKPKPKPVER